MASTTYSTSTPTTAKVLPPVFLAPLVLRKEHAVYRVMLRTPDGLGRKVGTIRRDGTTWRTLSPGSNGTLYATREEAMDAAVNLHRRTTALVNHPAAWQASLPVGCETCGDDH